MHTDCHPAVITFALLGPIQDLLSVTDAQLGIGRQREVEFVSNVYPEDHHHVTQNTPATRNRMKILINCATFNFMFANLGRSNKLRRYMTQQQNETEYQAEKSALW